MAVNENSYVHEPSPTQEHEGIAQPLTQQDALVKHTVDRFLGWRLPENFCPDGGISFTTIGNPGTPYEYANQPSGTNLLSATQAEAMVRYMLEGAPAACSPGRPAPNPEWEAKAAALAGERPDDAVDPAETLRMLKRWTAEAEPANEHGQISFSRAMLESAARALEVVLAPRPSDGSASDRVTEGAGEEIGRLDINIQTPENPHD